MLEFYNNLYGNLNKSINYTFGLTLEEYMKLSSETKYMLMYEYSIAMNRKNELDLIRETIDNNSYVKKKIKK